MKDIEINSRLWIAKKGKPFLGAGRITLLEKIESEGSINKAAKEMKMSYKRAWEIINHINEMADEPLVVSTTGGAGGGGTLLTEKGKKMIAEFRRIDTQCRNFLAAELENCCF